MRTLKRNKRDFYYALFNKAIPVTQEDEWGNLLDTGETQTVYGDPIKLRANISAAKGEAETQIFGESLQYDKVIVIADPNTPIDEITRLWIDKMPVLDEEGATQTPHDYETVRVARSLNSASIAVRKVNVSK